MTVLIETLSMVKLLSDMAVQGIEPRTTQVIIFEWKFPIFEYHAWLDSQNPSHLLESSFHTKLPFIYPQLSTKILTILIPIHRRFIPELKLSMIGI